MMKIGGQSRNRYSESKVAQGKLMFQLPEICLILCKLSSIDDVNCTVLTNPEAEFMNVQVSLGF
jgi:hypothetical protein